MKNLVFQLVPLNDGTIQMFSWIEGKKKATFYCHGEFSDTREMVESIRMRNEAN